MHVEEFLEHHGIKGMRWGVRRSRGSSGRVASEDHSNTRSLMKKHVSELDNKQIQTVNARLNLEQSFRRLNPSVVKRGQNSAKEILTVVGTAAALTALVANSPQTISTGRDLVAKFIGPSIKAGIKSIGT